MSNEYADAVGSLRSKNWLRIQTDLVDQFASGIDGEKIHAAASHFMVARQFPKRGNVRARDFDALVSPLCLAVKDISRANLVERVNNLADQIENLDGVARGRPISAASKLVWCASPGVGVIYDKHARSQLLRLGHKVPAGNYSMFAKAFSIESDRRSGGLKEAVEKNNVGKYEWLTEKLLDHWLYLEGKK